MKNSADYDLVIVGGGPVGLAFAAALKGLDLRLCLIEKQPESALANPAIDGRDIALTHSAIRILKELSLLQHIPADVLSPIKEARVLNGTSPYFLSFEDRKNGTDALGYLVSNHLIRKAAYEAVKGQKGLHIRTGLEVTGIHNDRARNLVTLSNGDEIEASLVVAADSRFSNCRSLMGIPVAMRDFGRTAVVCRMKTRRAHEHIAYECFHYGRTLAILPLNGHLVSAVITLPSDEADELCRMPENAFSRDITQRFGDKHGDIKLTGKRYSYPLVATYADRFVGPRFALLGDAAVGMHPVTAHGYNFGLYGLHVLAKEIRAALGLGLDIGDAAILDRYSRAHRRATMPIYLGTNTLVALYTNEKPAAKLARGALLRFSSMASPVKAMITRQLTQTSLAR